MRSGFRHGRFRLFCGVLLVASLAGRAVASGAEAVQQPILPGFAADPSARVFGDKLFIYPSHDLPGSRSWDAMYDFHVFVSNDAKTFTDLGKIFSVDDLTWAKKRLWAPDCVSRNGKYYLYYAADAQIGVAVGDSPAGPFKDPLGKPLLPARSGGLFTIDPCVLIDDDGQAYLYFGNDSGKVGVVKLQADMISLAGPVQVLPLKHYHEGIWVNKHNGLYYFSYPSNVGDKVANLMEYSTATGPTGPFTYRGVIVDNRSRNIHGSLVDFRGNSYVVYHIQGPSPYERRTYMNRITYNPDGAIQPLGAVHGVDSPATQQSSN